MATKKILFELEINGSQAAIKNATDLKLAIAEVEKQLKTTSDDTVYDKLEQQAFELRAALAGVNEQNRQTIRQFQAEASAPGSYVQLNQELSVLRRQFKELSAEERSSDFGKTLVARIQQVDKELKDIDASLGQFQRNVGNYPKEVTIAFDQVKAAIGGAIPGFEQLNRATGLATEGVRNIGTTATASGKLLSAAFVGFQVLSLILQGVQAVGEFTRETVKLRGEIQKTGVEFENLSNATAEIQATAVTFGQDVNDVFLSAQNLAQAFGITVEEATGIIQKGFLDGANTGGELLDVLREYPRLFEQAGFSAQEFVDIQTLAAREGVFSDKGVDAVKEFSIRIREQTNATTQSLREAFGPEFADNLFKGVNDGSITVRDALVRVSSEFKKTELPAKQLQQVISDVFGAPGEDAGDAFLSSLSELEGGIKRVSNETNILTERQREQLAAEVELAQAKNQLTIELEELGAGFTTVGTVIQSTFLRALAAVLDVLGGVPSVFRGVRAEVEQTAKSISDFFNRTLIDAQIFFAQVQSLNPLADEGAQDRLGNEIFALRSRRKEFEEEGKAFGRAYIDAFRASEEAASKEAAANRKARDEKENEEDRKRREVFLSKAQQDKAKKEQEDARKEQERQNALRTAALNAEERYGNERLLLLNELSRRLTEVTIENIQEQERQEIERENLRFDNVLSTLKAQEGKFIQTVRETREKIVEAYGDGSAQVREFERQSTLDLQQQREAAQDVEQQEEIRHQETLNDIRTQFTQSRAAERLEETRRELDAQKTRFEQIETIERTRYTELVNEVLTSTLSQVDKERLILRLDFQAETTSLERELISISEQAATVQERINEISEGTDLAPAVSVEEFDTLLSQLEAFNLQRAELEREYTELVQAEIQKRNGERLAETERLLSSLEQTVGLLDDFQAQAAQRELDANQEAIDVRQDNLDNLREQYDNAAEEDKKTIDDRIKAEEKAIKKLADEREKLEDKESKRQKAIAIVQSIIQGALNVVRALGTPPVPNIGAAVAAGIFSAAQTALIAAQPAAEGGLIGQSSGEISNENTFTLPQIAAAAIISAKGVAQSAYTSGIPTAQIPALPRADNGIISMRPNIPRLSNGDEVLATVKRGEVVLNRRQQAALGGAPVFRAIRVPGFAEGGVAGSVIGAPDVSGISGQDRMRKLEDIASALAAGQEATNRRIDRLRVYVVSEDVREDLADGDALQAAATLG